MRDVLIGVSMCLVLLLWPLQFILISILSHVPGTSLSHLFCAYKARQWSNVLLNWIDCEFETCYPFAVYSSPPSLPLHIVVTSFAGFFFLLLLLVDLFVWMMKGCLLENLTADLPLSVLGSEISCSTWSLRVLWWRLSDACDDGVVIHRAMLPKNCLRQVMSSSRIVCPLLWFLL